MVVTVLFFGATAEVAGTRDSRFALPEGATASEALDFVVASHPALGGRKLLFAVNQEYAKGDEILRDNDELAVFTAVSGG